VKSLEEEVKAKDKKLKEKSQSEADAEPGLFSSPSWPLFALIVLITFIIGTLLFFFVFPRLSKGVGQGLASEDL